MGRKSSALNAFMLQSWHPPNLLPPLPISPNTHMGMTWQYEVENKEMKKKFYTLGEMYGMWSLSQ